MNRVRGFSLPQCQWDRELTDYAGVMLGDHQKAHPEAAGWRLARAAARSPNYSRLARTAIAPPLARETCTPSGTRTLRHEARLPRRWPRCGPGRLGGRRSNTPTSNPGRCSRGPRNPALLAEILARVLPRSDRYLVKVTWHGYATGTFTGRPRRWTSCSARFPAAAVILEGHTSSRNVDGLDIDWETESGTAPGVDSAARN